jgi:hypothetical protein
MTLPDRMDAIEKALWACVGVICIFSATISIIALIGRLL